MTPGSVDRPRRSVSASHLASLLAGWRTDVRTAGGGHQRAGRAKALHRALADAIRLLILDGRLPLHVWLPGERDLAAALNVSRTTTAAAYASLRDSGFLTGRARSAPWTTLPTAEVTAGIPSAEPDADTIDLAQAAMPAPAGLLHQAAAAAIETLPRHMAETGYELTGLPDLRAAVADTYSARGLATVPEQIMVTLGAQHAWTLVLRLLAGAGDRVLVDHPTYPNALQIITQAGCRPVPVPLHGSGWDIDMLGMTMRQSAPRIALLVPDFHNPTGLLMDTSARMAVAEAAATMRTLVVVDETFVELPLDGVAVPPPLAVHDRAGAVISIGSMSKSYWGGLRIGWIRAQRDLIDRLVGFRPAIDLGTPILDQLTAVHLLCNGAPALAARRAELEIRRGALVRALADHLPTWRYRLPSGGMSMWCELEAPVSPALAIVAERHGVRIAPGTRFGVGGAFGRFVRIPYALPEPVIRHAVERLAAAYALVAAGGQERREPAALTVT